MEALKIKIQSLADAKEGISPIEGMTLENSESTKDLTVCILEDGTISGATSLMFILKMKDGTHKVAEMTQGQFEGLREALQGTLQRFGK